MAKKSTIDYVCQSCGAVYPKWQGKCDACGEWNTIVEEKRASEEFSNISTKKPGNQIDFVSLNGESQTYKRLVTNLSEINRVSGGWYRGQLFWSAATRESASQRYCCKFAQEWLINYKITAVFIFQAKRRLTKYEFVPNVLG